LHFLGNKPGNRVAIRLGWGILSPLVVADYKAANVGLEKKKVFIQKHFDSDLYQRHQVYIKGYNEHFSSYIFGRQLSKWGVVGSGIVEGCNLRDPKL